jgi:hypothetical protein
LEGRISKLSLDKENKLKEGSWRIAKGGRSILCFGEGKGGEGVCEKGISSCV